jgi:hypothetical protein
MNSHNWNSTVERGNIRQLVNVVFKVDIDDEYSFHSASEICTLPTIPRVAEIFRTTV